MENEHVSLPKSTPLLTSKTSQSRDFAFYLLRFVLKLCQAISRLALLAHDVSEDDLNIMWSVQNRQHVSTQASRVFFFFVNVDARGAQA